MPLGYWDEKDWHLAVPTLPSALPVLLEQSDSDEPWHQSHHNIAGRNSNAEKPLKDVEAQSAPLLHHLSDLRRSKISSRSSYLPVLGQKKLKGASASDGQVSARKFSSAENSWTSVSSREPTDALLNKSSNLLKTWKTPADDEPAATSFRYAIPSSSRSTSARTMGMGTSVPSSASTLAPTRDRSQRSSFIANSFDEDDDIDSVGNARLNLPAAVDLLAKANIPAHMTKDMLGKLLHADATGTSFSNRFLKTCNLYCNLVDQVFDFTKWLDTFQDGVATKPDDSVRMIVPRHMEAKRKAVHEVDEMSNVEHLKVTRMLRSILVDLESFNSEYIAQDFKRWVASQEANETLLRDFFEHIQEQERDVLNLLATSRCLVEESLGTHVLSAARALTDFHAKMKTEILEARKEGMYVDEQTLERTREIQNFIDHLDDAKERQIRQLKVSRSVYNHLYTSAENVKPPTLLMSKTNEETGTGSDMKRTATVIVQADGVNEGPSVPSWSMAADANKSSMRVAGDNLSSMESGTSSTTTRFEKTPTETNKKSRLLEAANIPHVEKTLQRRLMRGRQCVDQIAQYASERLFHYDKIRRLLRKEQWAKQRAATAGVSSAHTTEDASAMVADSAAPTCSGTQLIDVTALNRCMASAEQIEVQYLMQRRRELWDDLNGLHTSVDFSMFMADVDSKEMGLRGDAIKAVGREVEVSRFAHRGAVTKSLVEHGLERLKTPKRIGEQTQMQTQTRTQTCVLSPVSGRSGSPVATFPEMRQQYGKGTEPAGFDAGPILTQISLREQTLKSRDKTMADLELQCRQLAHSVNKEFGKSTWVLDAEEQNISFCLNPISLVVNSLIDVLAELVKFASGSGGKCRQARDTLFELHDKFVELSGNLQQERSWRCHPSSNPLLGSALRPQWNNDTNNLFLKLLDRLISWSSLVSGLKSSLERKNMLRHPQHLDNMHVNKKKPEETLQRKNEELEGYENETAELEKVKDDLIAMPEIYEKVEKIRREYKEQSMELQSLETKTKEIIKCREQVEQSITNLQRNLTQLPSARGGDTAKPVEASQLPSALGADLAEPVDASQVRRQLPKHHPGLRQQTNGGIDGRFVGRPAATGAQPAPEMKAWSKDTDVKKQIIASVNAPHESSHMGPQPHSGHAASRAPMTRPRPGGATEDPTNGNASVSTDEAPHQLESAAPLRPEVVLPRQSEATASLQAEAMAPRHMENVAAEEVSDGSVSGLNSTSNTHAALDRGNPLVASAGAVVGGFAVPGIDAALGGHAAQGEFANASNAAAPAVRVAGHVDAGDRSGTASASSPKSTAAGAGRTHADGKQGKGTTMDRAVHDKARIVKMIDKQVRNEKVLLMRVGRKKQEMQRLHAKIKQVIISRNKADNDGAGVQKSAQKRHSDWVRQMQAMKDQLKTFDRMHSFWQTRFEQWYQEVRERHGDEIVEILTNADRELASPVRHGRQSQPQRHSREKPTSQPTVSSCFFRQQTNPLLVESAQERKNFARDLWETQKHSNVPKVFESGFSALRFGAPPAVNKQNFAETLMQMVRSRTLEMGLGDNGRGSPSNFFDQFNFEKCISNTSTSGQFADAFSKGRGKALSNLIRSQHLRGGKGRGKGGKGAPLKVDSLGDAMLPALSMVSLSHGKLDQFAVQQCDGLTQQPVQQPQSYVPKATNVDVLRSLVFRWNNDKGRIKGGIGSTTAALRASFVRRSLKKPVMGGRMMKRPPGNLQLEVVPSGQFRKTDPKRVGPFVKTNELLDPLGAQAEDSENTRKKQDLSVTFRSKKFAKLRKSMSITDAVLDEDPGTVSMLKLFMGDVEGEKEKTISRKSKRDSGISSSFRPSRFGLWKNTELQSASKNIDSRRCSFRKGHTSMNKEDEASCSSSDSSSVSSSSSKSTGNPESGLGSSDEEAAMEGRCVWRDAGPQQRGLRLLRSISKKFVQRFGSVDKAYIKCVPAVTGLTYDVFKEVSLTMGFSEQDVDLMFASLMQMKPLNFDSRRMTGRVATGLRRMDPKPSSGWGSIAPVVGHADCSMTRHEFVGTLHNTTPVRSLAHLRVRLRSRGLVRLNNLRHMLKSDNTGSRTNISAPAFRDLLVACGVSASEARHLFMEIFEHSERGGKAESAVLSCQLMLRTLAMAEGLSAAKRLRLCLEKLSKRNPAALTNARLVDSSACHQCGLSARSANEDVGARGNSMFGSRRAHIVTNEPLEICHVQAKDNLANQTTKLAELYDVFFDQLGMKHPPSRVVNSDEFSAAVQVFQLPPADTHAIFKLADVRATQRVALQEIAVRALAGIGGLYEALCKHLGLSPMSGGAGQSVDAFQGRKGNSVFDKAERVARLRRTQARRRSYLGNCIKVSSQQAMPPATEFANVLDMRSKSHETEPRRKVMETIKFRRILDNKKFGVLAANALRRSIQHEAEHRLKKFFEKPDASGSWSGAEGDAEDVDDDDRHDAVVSAANGVEVRPTKHVPMDTQASMEGSAACEQSEDNDTRKDAHAHSINDVDVDPALVKRRGRAKSVVFAAELSPAGTERDDSPARRKSIVGLSSAYPNLSLGGDGIGSPAVDALGVRGHGRPRKKFRLLRARTCSASRPCESTTDSSKDGFSFDANFAIGAAAGAAALERASVDRHGPLSQKSCVGRTFETGGHSVRALSRSGTNTKPQSHALSQPPDLLGIIMRREAGETYEFKGGDESVHPVGTLDLELSPRGDSAGDGQRSSAEGSIGEGAMPTAPSFEAQPFDEPSGEEPYVATPQDLLFRERLEREQHERRLDLFDGDLIELEIATRKLQEVRAVVLKRARGLTHRAFDEFAGSQRASLTPMEFQERLVRVLKFNPLDAARVKTLAMTIGGAACQINFQSFWNLMRFAKPVGSVLEFRARLVQRYGTLEAALRVLDIESDIELSVDLFERRMIGAGIISTDTFHVFKRIDALQENGPRGFISSSAIQFAFDHAHVVSWFELMHHRFGSRAAERAAFDRLGLSMDAPYESAADFEQPLKHLGFPKVCVLPVYKMLTRSGTRNPTLGDLATLFTNASDESCTVKHADKSAVGKDCKDGKEGPSELVRDIALEATLELRLYVTTNFVNYSQAYMAIEMKRPADGVDMSDWEQAIGVFGFVDLERWMLVFGHIIEWKHPRWDRRCKNAVVHIPLARFAEALNQVTPCLTVAALKARLLEKHASTAKAWVALAGKEGAEKITLTQWQSALQSMSVLRAHSAQIFAILRAMQPASTAEYRQELSRTAFLAALKPSALEVNTRLLTILNRLSQEHGPVSRAFEGFYPHGPVPFETFRNYVGRILACSHRELSLLFQYSDVQVGSEGFFSIDELLDMLTTMQAAYLPYGERDIVETLACASSETSASTHHVHRLDDLDSGELASAASQRDRSEPDCRTEGPAREANAEALRGEAHPRRSDSETRGDHGATPGGVTSPSSLPTSSAASGRKLTNSTSLLRDASTALPDDDTEEDEDHSSSAKRPRTTPGRGQLQTSRPQVALPLLPAPNLAGWKRKSFKALPVRKATAPKLEAIGQEKSESERPVTSPPMHRSTSGKLENCQRLGGDRSSAETLPFRQFDDHKTPRNVQASALPHTLPSPQTPQIAGMVAVAPPMLHEPHVMPGTFAHKPIHKRQAILVESEGSPCASSPGLKGNLKTKTKVEILDTQMASRTKLSRAAASAAAAALIAGPLNAAPSNTSRDSQPWRADTTIGQLHGMRRPPAADLANVP